jgi:hypothetical protein
MFVQLGIPLPTATYMKNNLAKDVHYWHAKLLGGTFAKNDEVIDTAELEKNLGKGKVI